MQIEKRKMYQVVTKLDIVLVNKTVENSFYIEATDSEMKELSEKLDEGKAVVFYPVNYPLAGRRLWLAAQEVRAIAGLRLDEKAILEKQHRGTNLYYPTMRLDDIGIFTLWQDLKTAAEDQEKYQELLIHISRADKLIKHLPNKENDKELGIIHFEDYQPGSSDLQSVMALEASEFKKMLEELNLPEAVKTAFKHAWERTYGKSR